MKSPAPRSVIAIAGYLLLGATGIAVLNALPDTLTVVTPERVMALGDSITRGGGSGWGEGYRLPLVQRMVADRYTSDMVGSANHGPPWLYDRNHDGYNGQGIAFIDGIVTAELTTHHPDYVLLMIGSNDIQWGTNPDTVAAGLSALIDHLTAVRPTANIVVASITPLSDPALDASARAYNAAIPGIVQAKVGAGKLVSFVDMYPLLSLSDFWDGVHPNDAGYAKLAAAWAQKLATLRATPPAISTRTCPCTMWGPNDTPANPEVASTTSAEVGVKFRTEKDGFITGVRFYKGPNNTGTHVASLWKASNDPLTWTASDTTMTGTLLANGTVSSGSSAGWQEVVFAAPVPVKANTLYFATYYAPSGRYAADPGYFRDREIVHSPLRLPSQGSIDGNGFINEGGPGLPLPSPQGDTNYWVDVIFTPSAPSAPATVTATAVSSSQINVGWTAAADATGYRVERTTNGSPWAALTTTNGSVTSYNDTGLPASTAYSYRVVATNSGGESAPSSVATATTQPLPLPAPASATATAVSSTQIDVSWSSSENATGYRVERSPNGTTWAPLTTTSAGVTNYSNTGLQPLTTYYYRVVATNAGRDSLPSPVASATTQAVPDTTPPTAPTGLKAASAKGKANLSWTGSTDNGGSGLAGYKVGRSTSGASGPFTVVGTTSGTSYSDTVTGGSTYWYRVTAVDNAGNQSLPSNVISAQPK